MFIAGTLLVVSTLLVAEARMPYIIGGNVSAKGRWPHQVSLYMKSPLSGIFEHSCGGSVINEHWILTAAHCVMYSKTLSDYKVRLGMFQLSANDYEQELPIAQIIDWDMFEPGAPHDICLLRVEGTIDLTNQYISTIPLAVPTETYAGYPDCWISGWGRDDRASYDPSDLLKEAHVPVLTNEVCQQKYGPLIHQLPVSTNHVCIGDPDVADVHACHGDSGGPLVCRRNGVYELVGVTSRTGSESCSGNPSVYMRVSMFLDWINDTVA